MRGKARCNKCGKEGLSWKNVGGWKLYDGIKGRHTCETPSMNFIKEKKKVASIIGICFNGHNLNNGLLEAIKRGEYV